MADRRGKFSIDLTPKKSYDEVITEKTTDSKKSETPKEIKQVSLLLDIEQFIKVNKKAKKEDISKTKLIKRHLIDTGFFDE